MATTTTKQLILNVYNNLGELVAQSEKGNYEVTLKGINSIADKQYSVAFLDAFGNVSELEYVPKTTAPASASPQK